MKQAKGFLSFLKGMVGIQAPKKHRQVVRQISHNGKKISYHEPSESSPVLYIEENLGPVVKVGEYIDPFAKD